MCLLEMNARETSICSSASCTLHTPAGMLLLTASSTHLLSCRWVEEASIRQLSLAASNEVLATAVSQLQAYFNGTRHSFCVPIRAKGTSFQQTVWQALLDVPYATTLSYARLASLIGRPTAVRAVANACHCNPLAVIIPCHRIVGSNGKLIGYAGGLAAKRFLLDLEGQGQ